MKEFLMLSHPLDNFEIQKYQNEPKFHGFYSKNILLKIKHWVYVINLDNWKPIGAHWIVLCVNGNNVIYFHSFWVEHIPQEIKNP